MHGIVFVISLITLDQSLTSYGTSVQSWQQGPHSVEEGLSKYTRFRVIGNEWWCRCHGQLWYRKERYFIVEEVHHLLILKF